MAREKNSPGLVLQKHCSAVQLMDRDERQRVLALQQVLQGPAPLANFVQDLEVRGHPMGQCGWISAARTDLPLCSTLCCMVLVHRMLAACCGF